MALSAPVLTDDSPLSRADRALYGLERLLALLAGVTVFGLVLMAVVSVAGRNFFNQPLPGYVDWIEQAMPLIAFLGIAYVMRDGGHIRMDLVIGRLRGRWLWAAEWINTLAVLILIALLIWGSWAHFARSFDITAPLWSRDSSMDIGLPIWPAKLLAPLSFGVLGLRLILQLWAYTAAFIAGADRPVAVPLPETAADQAAREAAHVAGQDG